MKSKKVQVGYSITDTRTIVDAAIDQSVERLRRRLRTAWKKQAGQKQRGQYGVTV